MIPIILISDQEKDLKQFIANFSEDFKISPHFVFEIYPENKEISINQIREIKKNIIFNFSHPLLIVIHNFDTSSYEAQNAFLKTLEEHNENIQFVLSVKNQYKLAPTVRSRSKLLQLKKPSWQSDQQLDKKLEEFLKKGSLSILSDIRISMSLKEDASGVFNQIVLFFKRRLEHDSFAPKVIKQILYWKAAVENNNVTPQTALDHIFIFIRQTYNSRPVNKVSS